MSTILCLYKYVRYACPCLSSQQSHTKPYQLSTVQLALYLVIEVVSVLEVTRAIISCIQAGRRLAGKVMSLAE